MKIWAVPQSAEIVTPVQTLLEAPAAIERAARDCYQSAPSEIAPSETDRFISKLIARGHEGPLEFGSLYVRVRTSRGIANEIVRHRLFSFCQESTRYVDYVQRGFVPVVLPGVCKDNAVLADAYLNAYRASADAYASLIITQHQHQQNAREVLPIGLATYLNISGNFREWRHFFKLRLAPSAHPDIKALARSIQKQLFDIAVDADNMALNTIFHQGIMAE